MFRSTALAYNDQEQLRLLDVARVGTRVAMEIMRDGRACDWHCVARIKRSPATYFLEGELIDWRTGLNMKDG